MPAKLFSAIDALTQCVFCSYGETFSKIFPWVRALQSIDCPCDNRGCLVARHKSPKPSAIINTQTQNFFCLDENTGFVTCPRYLTLAELSAQTTLSESTLKRLCQKGAIPFYQPGGPRTRIVFPPDAIEQALFAGIQG